MAAPALYDILVIGGGINGCGIARDAAGRGLSVLLCEMNDLASGTSSWSTKLIHGGLRYLARGEIHLVREALLERGLLLRNAPHLVHPRSFLVPCRNPVDSLKYAVGLRLYDYLAGGNNLGRSRWIGRDEALRPSTTQELKATSVIGMDIEEASAKIRAKGNVDEAEDMSVPVWAGVIPIMTVTGTMQPCPHNATNAHPGGTAAFTPGRTLDQILTESQRRYGQDA